MRTIDSTQRLNITDTRSTASLLAKVLWITTVGFIATAFGAYLSPAILGGGISIGLFLVTFTLIIGVNFTSRTSPTLALVLFYAFTLLMGVEVGPLIKLYLHAPDGVSIVFNAAMTTAVGMAVMALIAQIARFNYDRVANYAFAALIGLLILGLLGSFVYIVSPGFYAWATLAVFTVLLLVDFMRLRDGGRGLTPVQLSLSIYLDALNIFMALLEIFGSNSRSRNSNSGGWN